MQKARVSEPPLLRGSGILAGRDHLKGQPEGAPLATGAPITGYRQSASAYQR